MTNQNNSDLSSEWQLLQNQFDAYEKHSLLIKLFAITLMTVSLIAGLDPLLSAALLAIVWLQDAIWKTFQSRIETRLMAVETAISEGSKLSPYQFNREWLLTRPGVVGLISEYLKHMLKPTIAYPHVLLLLTRLIAG